LGRGGYGGGEAGTGWGWGSVVASWERKLEQVSERGGDGKRESRLKGVWSERVRAKNTFGCLGFLAVHAELAVAGEERGVVVVSTAAVDDFVVFLKESP